MEIDLTDKNLYNEVYLPAIFGTSRYLLLMGGRDSGKSFAVCQKILFHLLNDVYCKVILVRKVAGTIKESQYATLVSLIHAWNLEHLFHITKSPMEIRCVATGNRVITFGLDDAEKTKSLDSPTLIWVEESTEITREDFIKLDTSIRCSNPNVPLQHILSFNPTIDSHWLNGEFFPPKNVYEKPEGRFHWVKSIKEGAKILHTTYRDNKWCPPSRSNIYEGLDEEWRQLYAYGLWGQAVKGLVFENVEYQDMMPGIEDRKKIAIGLDFGFTQDQTAIVECCIGPNGYLYVEEICYKTGLHNINVPGNDRSIQQVLDDEEIPKSWEIICDSAEPKSISELQSTGYNVVGVKKGKGSIARGIEILKRYKIVICGNSKHLKEELKLYRAATDKNDDVIVGKYEGPHHAIDALRYYALHMLGQSTSMKVKSKGSLWY